LLGRVPGTFDAEPAVRDIGDGAAAHAEPNGNGPLRKSALVDQAVNFQDLRSGQHDAIPR
jgi:hypothetical protein